MTSDYDSIQSMSFHEDYGSFIATEKSRINLEVFPNPACDVVYIKMNTDNYRNYTASIYSLEGKIIKQIPIESNVIKFAAADLEAGMYEIVIRDATGQAVAVKGFIKGSL